MSMANAVLGRGRVVVDGRFFRLGDQKFYVKGVTYGPFAPDGSGLPFAAPEQTRRDFELIRSLGANVVRVYHVPPRWFLDLAQSSQLFVLIDIPWSKHLSFDTADRKAGAREAVRQAIRACQRHPAVFAFSVVNEIPPDLVRWMGPRHVAEFIDELIAEAKKIDPDCLCTFGNFPSTEFLMPQGPDFLCFNVYLHQERPFQNYLARLQMMADAKPLVLGEFGVDTLREGEERQREMLSWQIEDAFRAGLAGVVVFSFTDDWHRDGRQVDDWKMGLTNAARAPKPAFDAVRSKFLQAPYFPLPRCPRISVVVASYNGERTLKTCLESLQRLHYPDYEIILVDDGSTDATPQIVNRVRWSDGTGPDPAAAPREGLQRFVTLRHEVNRGLSAARNTGIAAARGEVVAFTDSDCRVDEDWLYYLAADLLGGEYAGIGGPNLLPPEDSHVAAAVMVSPGGPAHVMLTDRQAEHIPGCNMAFYKWVLEEIGGFDPQFRRAGDDVDLCWRLQQAGYRIGFSPAAFVWHNRRSTVAAYLRQQQGYGEAEALLVQKHPENFNSLGGGVWRGRIYAPSKFGLHLQPPVIYHGLFGSAGFQRLYASEPATTLMLCTTPEYYLLVLGPLAVLSVVVPYLWPLAIAALLVPIVICAASGAQAVLPRNRVRWWSRPLVALLFFLQPIVRGAERYRGRLTFRPRSSAARQSLDSEALRISNVSLSELDYWTERGMDRLQFVAAVLERLDQEGWTRESDIGWSNYDVLIHGTRWSHLELTTLAEEHSQGRRKIRCRLRTRWSLDAVVAFWTLAAAGLLVIGLLHSWRPWSWLLLGSLPLAIWYLQFDQRNLQSLVAVFLDELARDNGLTRIQAVPAPQDPAIKAPSPPP
ncbi:MAG: glycosyltransferase [Verrucomicrobiota bacterium]